jgi:hypothetical protein
MNKRSALEPQRFHSLLIPFDPSLSPCVPKSGNKMGTRMAVHRPSTTSVHENSLQNWLHYIWSHCIVKNVGFSHHCVQGRRVCDQSSMPSSNGTPQGYSTH